MEKIFYELADSLYEGIYFIDTQRRILFWNKSAEEITGYKAEEVIGKGCNDNILRHVDEHENNLCENTCPMLMAMSRRVKVEDTVYLHHKTGYRLRVRVKGIPIIEDNQVKGVVEIFLPVFSTSDTEQDLLSLALKDSLTKILNRRGFETLCELRQREMLMLNYNPAILLFDIDDFKKINDTYGHDIGDKVLKAVAQTLQNIVRHQDIVSRWGGEEFLILVFIKEPKEINSIGNKIVKIIQSTWIEHDGEIIRFTVSGGRTMLKKEENILDAINRADNLMYQAKKSGKNRFISDI
ncbi:GGDEF domain-containing protein [Thermodesulfovibrio hydrogeniphilus]